MSGNITGRQIRAEIDEVSGLLVAALGRYARTTDLPDLLASLDLPVLRRGREENRGAVDLYCRFALTKPDGEQIEREVDRTLLLVLGFVYDRMLMLMDLKGALPEWLVISDVPEGISVRDFVVETLLMAGGRKHVA